MFPAGVGHMGWRVGVWCAWYKKEDSRTDVSEGGKNGAHVLVRQDGFAMERRGGGETSVGAYVHPSTRGFGPLPSILD